MVVRRRTTSRPRRLARTLPTAAQLQELLPASRGRSWRAPSVDIESGLVKRGGLARHAGDHLPGFRWDVPAPDHRRTLLWAHISFDWQFWYWRSLRLRNTTSRKVHVEGSLNWLWQLTGNPQIFSNDTILLLDEGSFSFETFVAPGAGGFDVGWIVPAYGFTFATPAKLGALMQFKKQGALRLWFGSQFSDITVEYSRAGVTTAGEALGGGPNTLYYSYAYTGRPRPIIDRTDIVIVES